MNEQTQESVPPGPATADQLRFTCPHCRLELTAPLAVAEVIAPCPGCGESIQAPPLPTSPAETVPEPRPGPQPVPQEAPATVPLPRAATTPEQPSKRAEEAWADEQAQPALPTQRKVVKRRKRSARVAKPDSGMTEEERREVKILIKFILSVLATAAITWAVCKVVSRSIMEGPPPSDSRPFTIR